MGCLARQTDGICGSRLTSDCNRGICRPRTFGAAPDGVLVVIENSNAKTKMVVHCVNKGVNGAGAFAKDRVLGRAVAHRRSQLPNLPGGLFGMFENRQR